MLFVFASPMIVMVALQLLPVPTPDHEHPPGELCVILIFVFVIAAFVFGHDRHTLAFDRHPPPTTLCFLMIFVFVLPQVVMAMLVLGHDRWLHSSLVVISVLKLLHIPAHDCDRRGHPLNIIPNCDLQGHCCNSSSPL